MTTMPKPAIPKTAVSRRAAFWATGVASLVVMALFYPTGEQLARVWSIDANYSHGYLVLPLSLALAWRIVGLHPPPRDGQAVLGGIVLALGLFVHFAGVVLRFLPLEWLALLLILRGLAVCVGGSAWADHLLFPTFFLSFLFPLPVAWTTRIAIWLQDLVASASTEVLGWFFLCFRRGNSIHIVGVQEMFVAQECSGVRQLIAFVALGSLIAHLGGLGFWRGFLLVCLALPVAIAANVLRVVLMGIGLKWFGTSWFFSWMHDLPALVTFPLGVALFLGLAWVITPNRK